MCTNFSEHVEPRMVLTNGAHFIKYKAGRHLNTGANIHINWFDWSQVKSPETCEIDAVEGIKNLDANEWPTMEASVEWRQLVHVLVRGTSD